MVEADLVRHYQHNKTFTLAGVFPISIMQWRASGLSITAHPTMENGTPDLTGTAARRGYCLQATQARHQCRLIYKDTTAGNKTQVLIILIYRLVVVRRHTPGRTFCIGNVNAYAALPDSHPTMVSIYVMCSLLRVPLASFSASSRRLLFLYPLHMPRCASNSCMLFTH